MTSLSVNLYCDEIKEQQISDKASSDQRWMYIGVLIVREEDEESLIAELLNRRCGNLGASLSWGQCDPPCKYHHKNDTEVHYWKLDSADRYYVARRWLDFLLEDRALTYFHILGVNMEMIDQSHFGNPSGQKEKARYYNRFFRMAVLRPLRFYFPKKTVHVEKIFHDSSALQQDEYFPWHTIYRIKRQFSGKVTFGAEEICFIDSDHRKSGDRRSNLIQYIDLILGASFNCLHCASSNKHKLAVAEQIYPLLSRLINAPENSNSRYNYWRRLSVDFFPKHRIHNMTGILEQAKRKDSFYKRRDIKLDQNSQFDLGF